MATTTPRETSEFPPFLRRIFKAYAKRVGAGDTYDLREMYELRAELDDAITEAIAIGRMQGDAWSWTNIADALSTPARTMTRQAAHARWAMPVERIWRRERHAGRELVESVRQAHDAEYGAGAYDERV